MPRHVAFLRGVNPMNARMPELKRCFERAGFRDVTTVLASGNVVFGGDEASEAVLVRKAEAAMAKHLGRTFPVIVRAVAYLRRLLESDPYAGLRLQPNAKRVVTFFRTRLAHTPALPIEADGARILAVRGREAFSAYVPGRRGPVFMTLIEKAFGTGVTTRTWETVKKCVAADPVSALCSLLAPGAPLSAACRYCYELRLHRARGYGALKAILDVLAEQEPLTRCS